LTSSTSPRRERTEGSRGERQIAWTDLRAYKRSGPVSRHVCVQGTDANHKGLTDNPEQYAAHQNDRRATPPEAILILLFYVLALEFGKTMTHPAPPLGNLPPPVAGAIPLSVFMASPQGGGVIENLVTALYG
jgi:hypothetical protein